MIDSNVDLLALAVAIDEAAEVIDITDRDYASELDRLSHVLRLRHDCNGNYEDMIAEIAVTEAARAAQYITPVDAEQLAEYSREQLAAVLNKERT